MRTLYSTLGSCLLVSLATPALGQGGEDPATAAPIPSLPFVDTGTTLGFADDSDEVCPFADSTSPDVYYAITPAADVTIDIDLCQSDYDTKVYVYDADLTLIACNDDACTDAAGNPFRSRLTAVPLVGGATHYVVIDGFGGEAGDYVMVVEESVADCTTAPPFLADGSALDFDGIDDFVKVAPAAALALADAITLETWVYPDAIPAFGNMITKASDITVNYALRYETDGSIGFFYRAASDTGWFEYNSDGGVIEPGRWQHVAVTHTYATADIAVYVDGLPVGGGWSATPTEGPMTSDESLLFGGTALTPGGTTTRLVDGRLDEVRIWNVVRTAEDIAAFRDAILDGDEPGLVGYWRFEEGAGGSTADSAGGFTGTLVGPAWFELAECAPPCPSDVDGSGEVGFTDLLAILSNWGPCSGCAEDLDGSGDVGFTDLLAVLSDWGACPVATGACCLPGACTDLTADECIARGGVYNAGENCGDIGCPGDDGWIVSAPLVWTGDTCNDDFDCDLGASRDARWQITIPADGSWTFSVCGASFDTVLYLGSAPCTDDLGFGDDDCDIASEIQVDLTAGVYYLTLEGFSSDECGGYTLAVSMK